MCVNCPNKIGRHNTVRFPTTKELFQIICCESWKGHIAIQLPKWCKIVYKLRNTSIIYLRPCIKNNLFKSYFEIAYIFFMIIVGWEHTDIGFQNKRNDIIKARNGKNVLNIWEIRTKGEGQGTFRLIAYKRGRFIRILRHYILKQVFAIINVKTSHDNDNPFLITMKY